MANIALEENQQHLVICDGCNVYKPHEHRCHGTEEIVRYGDILNVGCECPECREADRLFRHSKPEEDNKEQEEVYDLFTIVNTDNELISVGFMERGTWIIAETIMNLSRDELEEMGYKQVIEKWRRLPSEEEVTDEEDTSLPIGMLEDGTVIISRCFEGWEKVKDKYIQPALDGDTCWPSTKGADRDTHDARVVIDHINQIFLKALGIK